MPPYKGSIAIKKLTKLPTFNEKVLSLIAGNHSISSSGGWAIVCLKKIVLDLKRLEEQTEEAEHEGKSIFSAEQLKKLSNEQQHDISKIREAFEIGLRELKEDIRKARQEQYSEWLRDFEGKCSMAASIGDSRFFQDVATAIDKLSPYDSFDFGCPRTRFALLIKQYESSRDDHVSVKASSLTAVQVIERMREIAPDLDLDPREIRRWCKELGVKLAKEKPGRRKGQKNRNRTWN